MFINRRNLIGGAALLPMACTAAKSTVPTVHGPTISPEDLGWTSKSSPVETARIINEALQIAGEKGITYYDNAPRDIAGTVRLGGKVQIGFGSLHSWRAVYNDPNQFDVVEPFRNERPKRVFVDTAGARGSIIRGPVNLLCASPRNMTLAERSKIPADLVAITATRPDPSTEISIETLTISGFGHAFFQRNQPRAQDHILPYTRWSVGITIIRFCLAPIVTGIGGNGLDDAVFQILRLSRNAGTSVLRGTDLNIQSMFDFGLSREDDIEPGSVSLTAGRRQGFIANAKLEPGMIIGALGGMKSSVGESIPFVSEIESISGGNIVFADTPDEDFSGSFVINPPSFLLIKSSLNSLHTYFEGIHNLPIQLSNGSKLSTLDLKISGGNFGARGGYAISTMDAESNANIQLNPRSVNNKWLKGLVKQSQR